ncbi:unnamed protein product [Somion occarium]|uniref:C2H2-type domain-containing protein n=1 Tax=Somion occarium TaxID=3059160 RepID=A0ABP1DL26_9APHY
MAANAQEEFKCPECDVHASHRALLEHLWVHRGTQFSNQHDRTHKCPYPDCGTSLARSSGLTLHFKAHIGMKDQVCPHLTDSRPGNRSLCGFQTVYSTSLGKHRETMHGWNRITSRSVDPWMDDLTGNIEAAELKGGDLTWTAVLKMKVDKLNSLESSNSAMSSEPESCSIHRWIRDVAHRREAGDLHDETPGPLVQNIASPAPGALTTRLPITLTEEYLKRVGYERVWYLEYEWIWQLKY